MISTSSWQSPPDALVLDPASLKLWNVAQYHRLYDSGLIGSDERCELIAGQILLMSPKGTAHVLALRLLSNTLSQLIDDDTFISTQDPIQLDDFSEPEPDLAVVKGDILDYSERHPSPSDILLIVEVADATLKTDSEVKDKLYARANIPEYWVLDLKNRQLIVFRNPTATGYSDRLVAGVRDVISPTAFEKRGVVVEEILPPEARK